MRIVLEDKELMPYKKHTWDAGYDLKSNMETFTLAPGEKAVVHTGLIVEIPKRHVGLIFPRSGLGTTYEVMLANTIGVIDTDYRGEVMVWLVNRGTEPLEIKKYDRFCQLIIVPILLPKLVPVAKLTTTARGPEGFGSSGV